MAFYIDGPIMVNVTTYCSLFNKCICIWTMQFFNEVFLLQMDTFQCTACINRDLLTSSNTYLEKHLQKTVYEANYILLKIFDSDKFFF